MKKYSNLTLKVYYRIIELMLHYEIVPGQRLVFIDLAKQLGVSRTSVNNALSILTQEGYLDFVPNQGYSVHKLTRKEAENLYEFREVLEAGFLGKAMRNMNKKNSGTLKNVKRITRTPFPTVSIAGCSSLMRSSMPRLSIWPAMMFCRPDTGISAKKYFFVSAPKTSS